jgi:hypothetical protein
MLRNPRALNWLGTSLVKYTYQNTGDHWYVNAASQQQNTAASVVKAHSISKGKSVHACKLESSSNHFPENELPNKHSIRMWMSPRVDRDIYVIYAVSGFQVMQSGAINWVSFLGSFCLQYKWEIQVFDLVSIFINMVESVRFEVLTVKHTMFWVVTLCSLLQVHRYFRGLWRPRSHIPVKDCETSTELLRVTTQKIVLHITEALLKN